MKRNLLAIAVSILTLTGVTSATQILETPPSTNTTKPMPRPSLVKVLDKRPALPVKGAPVKTTTAPAMTGSTSTGTAVTGTQTVVQQVKQQNAQDVADYRAENGYITRYLMKQTTVEGKQTMGSAIETAIKTLLATQKIMIQTYQAAAASASGALMTEDTWNTLSDQTVDTYHDAVLPYIDPTKIDTFNTFIIGRIHLMKGLFDKLETIRLVKKQ